MAYQKQTWENLPSQNTPITAERLNHIEDGIEEAWEHGGGGGETLPVGTELDFDGQSTDIPTGWEQIDNPESYSTSEVKTNKVWQDGKPIYRNWVSFLNPQLSAGSAPTVAHNIPNIDKVVGIEKWQIRQKNSTTATAFFPSMTTGGAFTTIHLVDATYVYVRSRDSWGAGNYYFEGYVEYTKTTD